MTGEQNSFKKFEEELIKVEGEDNDAIKKLSISCKKFYDKAEKSAFKKDIVKWFDNNCEVIEDRKKMGIELLNNGMIRELFLSMMESLKIESDSEFYEYLDKEFGGIMF